MPGETSTRFVFAAVFVLAGGCATVQQTPVKLVPRVDHHQHLLSPAAAALSNRLLPALDLPGDLAELVAARVAGWNDSGSLRRLYADDAVVLGPEAPGWVCGGGAAADLYATIFTSAIHLEPVAYRSNGKDAHVAGYISRGNGAKPIGYFLLDLQKDSAGAWKIVAETPIIPGPTVEEVVTADDLIIMLDEAGIRRAVILSGAYYFDSPQNAPGGEEEAATRAENDWTAQQVARHPDRLVAFCSVNPLAVYALEEVDRCATTRRFAGLKLHFHTSGVDLLDDRHVQKVRRVAEAANRHGLAMLIHVRGGARYGAPDARALLDHILSAAPAVPIQVAHLWGGERFSEEALTAYAEAVEGAHPGARNLYFDVAMVSSLSEQDMEKAVGLMRRIGMRRILYGSDGPQFGGTSPAEAWNRFRSRVPLTEEEFRTIAANVAAYLR